MMKKVYICAPLGGNVKKNLVKTEEAAEAAVEETGKRHATFFQNGSGRSAFLRPMLE